MPSLDFRDGRNLPVAQTGLPASPNDVANHPVAVAGKVEVILYVLDLFSRKLDLLAARPEEVLVIEGDLVIVMRPIRDLAGQSHQQKMMERTSDNNLCNCWTNGGHYTIASDIFYFSVILERVKRSRAFSRIFFWDYVIYDPWYDRAPKNLCSLVPL